VTQQVRDGRRQTTTGKTSSFDSALRDRSTPASYYERPCGTWTIWPNSVRITRNANVRLLVQRSPLGLRHPPFLHESDARFCRAHFRGQLKRATFASPICGLRPQLISCCAKCGHQSSRRTSSFDIRRAMRPAVRPSHTALKHELSTTKLVRIYVVRVQALCTSYRLGRLRQGRIPRRGYGEQ
jgi:hypothetical protein